MVKREIERRHKHHEENGIKLTLPSASDLDPGTFYELLGRGEANAGSATRDESNLTFELPGDFFLRYCNFATNYQLEGLDALAHSNFSPCIQARTRLKAWDWLSSTKAGRPSAPFCHRRRQTSHR